MNEKLRISIRISRKFVPKGPSDNKSAFFQVMAWCRTGDKPLPEAMFDEFTEAYLRHYGVDELHQCIILGQEWLSIV